MENKKILHTESDMSPLLEIELHQAKGPSLHLLSSWLQSSLRPEAISKPLKQQKFRELMTSRS